MYTKKFITTGLDKSKPIILDTETLGLYGRTRLVQVRQGDIAYEYDCFYINIEDIKYFLKDAHLVLHNAFYDLSCIDFKNWIPRKIDCTMTASRMAFAELESFNLDNLSKVLNLGEKGEEGKSNWAIYNLNEKQLEYAANDTLLTQNLYYELLKTNVFEKNTYILDMEVLKICLFMQHRGMPTNSKYLASEKRKINKEIKELEKKIPEGLNILSPKQVCEYLHIDSSAKDKLILLAQNDKRCNDIVELRALYKKLNFIELFHSHSFLFTLLNPLGAKTGRFTSKGMDFDDSYTNLQQIPRELKEAFGFSEGQGYYICADYPNLELRLASAVYGEYFIAKCFKEGLDLHKETAVSLFNKPLDTITDKERKIAKICNFALLYGAGVKVLETTLASWGQLDYIPEAANLKKNWIEIYSGLKTLHRNAFEKYKGISYDIAYSPLGRPMRANTPNEYLNFPIQSAGSECTKLSLYFLNKAGITPVSSVHDSIICIAQTKEEAQEVAVQIKHSMEKAFRNVTKRCRINDLPIEVEVDIDLHYQ